MQIHKLFEAIEGYHNYRQVVTSLPERSSLQYAVNSLSTELMYIKVLRYLVLLMKLSILIYVLPYQMHRLLVVHLVKYAITSYYYEVELALLSNFESCDIRLCNNDIRVSFEFGEFCLYIAKGPRDRKPPRKDSVRPIDHLLLSFKGRVGMRYDRGILIDATTIFDNTFDLNIIGRFVII